MESVMFAEHRNLIKALLLAKLFSRSTKSSFDDESIKYLPHFAGYPAGIEGEVVAHGYRIVRNNINNDSHWYICAFI